MSVAADAPNGLDGPRVERPSCGYGEAGVDQIGLIERDLLLSVAQMSALRIAFHFLGKQGDRGAVSVAGDWLRLWRTTGHYRAHDGGETWLAAGRRVAGGGRARIDLKQIGGVRGLVIHKVEAGEA